MVGDPRLLASTVHVVFVDASFQLIQMWSIVVGLVPGEYLVGMPLGEANLRPAELNVEMSSFAIGSVWR